MLTTNSPVPPSLTGLALRSVSFSVPSSLFAGQIITIIGSDPIAVKNENGARFTLPSTPTVETNAIGRGTIPPISSLYRSARPICATSISMPQA